jgi:hypothetical protein
MVKPASTSVFDFQLDGSLHSSQAQLAAQAAVAHLF